MSKGQPLDETSDVYKKGLRMQFQFMSKGQALGGIAGVYKKGLWM